MYSYAMMYDTNVEYALSLFARICTYMSAWHIHAAMSIYGGCGWLCASIWLSKCVAAMKNSRFSTSFPQNCAAFVNSAAAVSAYALAILGRHERFWNFFDYYEVPHRHTLTHTYICPNIWINKYVAAHEVLYDFECNIMCMYVCYIK